jgi:putative ABC transport system substrate-binding protein
MKLNRSVARLLVLIAVGLALVAGKGSAQTPSKVYRVGLLPVGPAIVDTSGFGAALIQGFAKRGYNLGRNLEFERRAAEGQIDRLPVLVGELVASKVDLIITFGYPAALVAKQRVTTIPVIVAGTGDPVAAGLVDSLARPGGNLTGVSEVATDLSVKRLELLRETAPTIKRVAVLWNADDLAMTLRFHALEAAGRDFGIVIQPLGVRQPNDFEAAFSAMRSNEPDAILMVTDVLTRLNRKRVYEFAAAHRLPAIYEEASFAHEGGLMSYGPGGDEVFDRVAGLADRIFKGARPAELPLEQPTHFHLAVNLKTAEALGLPIPPSVLLRAEDVIE